MYTSFRVRACVSVHARKESNQEDLKVAKATDLSPPLMKRLKLTSEKVDTLVKVSLHSQLEFLYSAS